MDQESQQPSRFVVGIDLGTTNSALAYVDSEAVSEDAEFNGWITDALAFVHGLPPK